MHKLHSVSGHGLLVGAALLCVLLYCFFECSTNEGRISSSAAVQLCWWACSRVEAAEDKLGNSMR